MAALESIQVALPASIAAAVRRAVDEGEYTSDSEVVVDALREWTARRSIDVGDIQRLRRLVQESMDDPRPALPVDEVFDRLERKYQAMADRACGQP